MAWLVLFFLLQGRTMKLPFSEPSLSGSARTAKAKSLRDLATEVARLRPHALTRANGEEADHDKYPANFSKGLKHDDDGLIEDTADYRCFVEAINSDDQTLFEKHVETAKTTDFKCTLKADDSAPEWRGWESPRAGHVYELQGPDAGAVGMAPAPRVGSSELSAEMAEVYGLALIRDVPFSTIANGGDEKINGSGNAELSSAQVVDALSDMPFYDGDNRVSSTPCNTNQNGLNQFETNRRFARTFSDTGGLTTENVFRGSTPGAQIGPYISQFMLVGAQSIGGNSDGNPSRPDTSTKWDPQDGFIPYGAQPIDQRIVAHKVGLDHLTSWPTWLDAQNGAKLNGTDKFEKKRRYITTPRDLATYVHYDALYQAYLNAALILLGSGTKTSKGFPEPSPSGRRTAFATFGGPHILSLVTEVATRCLKAVRRQKFSYHRRARPEVMGGRFTLCALGESGLLGTAENAFEQSFNEIPADIRDAIIAHNDLQNKTGLNAHREVECDPLFPAGKNAPAFKAGNLLLPMAFPEGSPMHPAYGAGHATVAGGCITMLKAFFEMFEDADSGVERKLVINDNDNAYQPTVDGLSLEDIPAFNGSLTIQGELDKLAANISIGRNMAGVHYHSDYYDSLRMGERVAIGILMEQCPSYVETVELNLKSFDGDLISISGAAGAAPSLSVIDRVGKAIPSADWWLRHVSGGETAEDF